MERQTESEIVVKSVLVGNPMSGTGDMPGVWGLTVLPGETGHREWMNLRIKFTVDKWGCRARIEFALSDDYMGITELSKNQLTYEFDLEASSGSAKGKVELLLKEEGKGYSKLEGNFVYQTPGQKEERFRGTIIAWKTEWMEV